MVTHLPTIHIEAPVSGMAVTIVVCCSPAMFGASKPISSYASWHRFTSASILNVFRVWSCLVVSGRVWLDVICPIMRSMWKIPAVVVSVGDVEGTRVG